MTSKYSEELAAKICAELETGKTLNEICRADDMPTPQAVMNWVRDKDDFREMYRKSRVIQMFVYADKIMELCSAGAIPTPDDMAKRIGTNNPTYVKMALNAEIQRLKMESDSIKFLVAKLAPNLYPESFSNKIDVNHSGEVGNTINVINYAKTVARVIDAEKEEAKLLGEDSEDS